MVVLETAPETIQQYSTEQKHSAHTAPAAGNLVAIHEVCLDLTDPPGAIIGPETKRLYIHQWERAALGEAHTYGTGETWCPIHPKPVPEPKPEPAPIVGRRSLLGTIVPPRPFMV
jgi:hypothetical protein